jgi:hypothetical protein
MADNSGPTEQELDATIADRDSKYPTLTERGAELFKLLREVKPELTNWDITCFAVSWLGVAANEWLWLREPAAQLIRRTTTAHYMMEEENLVTEAITRGPRLVTDDKPSSEVQ